jgi:flavin reductase (DIM6/NTAB) family NADH-FMN oxidoreductase RutF
MSLDAATDDLRAAFRLAMRRFPAAVTVIMSADQIRRHGMTATAVTSLRTRPTVFPCRPKSKPRSRVAAAASNTR